MFVFLVLFTYKSLLISKIYVDINLKIRLYGKYLYNSKKCC